MLSNSPEWLPFNDFELKLSPDEIHIFRIAIEECYPNILADYANVLSGPELNRASRFLHRKDSRNYLVRKYYARRILSCFVKEAPGELQFSRTGNKKPLLKNIHFNVSHSNAYAVIVVNSSPLGVDIECVDAGFAFDSVLKTCFDAEEQAFVAQDEERHRFYSLWTRKEALLKASGEGLTDNLSSLNCLETDVLRNGKTYQLTTFYCHKQYLLSLATIAGSEKFKHWHICK
jgi:4'-phosphopantetheinyl transferase